MSTAERIRVRLAEAWPNLDADDPVFLDQVAHEAAFAVAPEVAALREKLAAAERERNETIDYARRADERGDRDALERIRIVRECTDLRHERDRLAATVKRVRALAELWVSTGFAPVSACSRDVLRELADAPTVDAGIREAGSGRSVELSQVSAYVWVDPASGEQRWMSPADVTLVMATDAKAGEAGSADCGPVSAADPASAAIVTGGGIRSRNVDLPEATGGDKGSAYARPRRLRSCIERWPEAETCAYDPRCCRFPKSCSATVYDDDAVTEADLEPLGSTTGDAP